MFRRLSALAAAAWVPLAWATGPVTLVQSEEPRAFGHTLGDVLERRVVLEVEPPYRLEESSLPKARRIGAWLEQRSPQFTTRSRGGPTRYEIVLSYQILNSPRELTTLALPEVALDFTGGGPPLRETLPEYPITAGPLTPEYILARAPLDETQPDAPPPSVPTAAIEARLLAYACAAAAILLFLAYRLWGIPFLAATRGPFARASGEVKRLVRAGTEAGRREAMRRIHRAFDETAGRAVFAQALPEFLARHPRYGPLGAEIERFFELTRLEFFAGRGTGADAGQWLAEFCRRCRSVERGTG